MKRWWTTWGHALIAAMTAAFVIGCSDDDTTVQPDNDDDHSGTATVRLHLDNTVDGTPLEMDTGRYPDTVGNTYSVRKLLYIVSDFEFHEEGKAGGRAAVHDFPIAHLRDGTEEVTRILEFELPVGEYSGLSFRFGLDDEDNVNASENGPWPPEWDGPMSWLPIFGGGLHIMKIEGDFTPVGGGALLSFRTHTGRQHHQTDDTHLSFDDPTPRFFTVDLPVDLHVHNGESWDVHVVMDVNDWYDGPGTDNDTTMDDYTGGVMMNMDIQSKLEANGPSCYSLGVVEESE